SEVRVTPRMRAMVLGDSPWSISSTARRRRRSSSAGVPMGLLIHTVRCPPARKDSLARLDSVSADRAVGILDFPLPGQNANPGVALLLGYLFSASDSVEVRVSRPLI